MNIKKVGSDLLYTGLNIGLVCIRQISFWIYITGKKLGIASVLQYSET